MGGGAFGGNYNNNQYHAGGVGGGGGVGPIPPNFANAHGVGLGFQAMGPGAMGGGMNGAAGMAGGAAMPPGMPPNQGMPGPAPFPMPPGMPPMGGVHPNQFMRAPPNVRMIPQPNEATGRLGRQCWKNGPREPEEVAKELKQTIRNAVVPAQFNRDTYLDRACLATEPVVLLTMHPYAAKVVTAYGLGKYCQTGGGPRSILDGRYFAFLGNGNNSVENELFVLPQDTLDAVADVDTGRAAEMATLDAIFAGDNDPSRLLPPSPTNPPLDPGTSSTMFMKVMPCPNGLVHAFADECHPYVALCRLRMVEDVMPTPEAKASLNMLQYWLRQACHSAAAGGPSSLAFKWEAAMVYGGDAGVKSWANTRHTMLLPSDPVMQVPVPANQQPVTAQDVLNAWAENSKSSGKEVQQRGCRKFNPYELEMYLANAGLSEDTTREELLEKGYSFVSEWETTKNSEPSMRQLMARRTRASAEELGITNFVRYLRKSYVDTVREQDHGDGLDTSWFRSNRGLCLAAVFYMIGSAEQAAMDTARDEYMATATSTTAEEEEKRLGKPGKSPKSLEELIKGIETYLILWHAQYKLKGSHASQVRNIRGSLRLYEGDGISITQETIDDIFWSITLDGRRTFRSPQHARQSGLVDLARQVAARAVVPVFGVPREQLSPSRVRVRAPTHEYYPDLGEGSRKKARGGFGEVKNYHPLIKAKWAELCEKVGDTPLVKDVLSAASGKDGSTHTLTSLTEEVLKHEICSVGALTGVCTNHMCSFNHHNAVSNPTAKKVVDILESAISSIPAKGGGKGVKKEKP